MIPFRRQVLLKAFKLVDLTIMAFSYLLASWVCSRPSGTLSFEQFLSLQISINDISFFLCLLLVWRILFSLCGLYRSRRISSLKGEALDLFKATSFGTGALLISARVFGIEMITPLFLAVFWPVVTGVAVSSRLVLRWGLTWIRLGGRNLRHVLIVGTNEMGIRLARTTEAIPRLGYRLIGFVVREGEEIQKARETGYPLVTDFKGFPSFLKDRAVDEVWFGLKRESAKGELSEIIDFCRKYGIITRFFPRTFNPEKTLLDGMSFDSGSVYTLYPAPIEDRQFLEKHVVDLFLSLTLLLLLSPLMAIAAILIKATSPGPVFFIQERMGLNRRRFRLYKFRTMILGADQMLPELEHFNEISGPVFKIKDDPRLTRIGRLLRRTSIDELPQLFNVLKGEMSLVGPRPLPVRDYNGFEQDWHRRRMCVPPGMTCLWQVNGRNSIPFDKWMELDLQYIDQWSLRLDFEILLQTVPAVFRGSGTT